MARWDDFNRFFAPSVPRAAKGGIRAQSQRGTFGESWWAKRWIAVLESFDLGSRLQRGRRYARQGQVLSIDVGKGQIDARVQGSRPAPYKVQIKIKPLSGPDWKKVAAAAGSQAIFASKLLSGEMPHEMEDAFRGTGASLFPASLSDLKTECSCPDWSNPCKHIAAVYYLLGEEFDRDPFLIFRTRGMTREEFLALLGENVQPANREPVYEAEPLPDDPEEFWTAEPLPENLLQEAPENATPAAVLQRLGKFPFWRGSEPVYQMLEGVYRDAAENAARTLEPVPQFSDNGSE